MWTVNIIRYKLFLFISIIYGCAHINSQKLFGGRDGNQNIYYKEFRMPGVTAKKDDDYICTGLNLNSTESWVLKYDPLASANTAHHMLLFGCAHINKKFMKDGFWDCGHHGVCPGGRIMYAWAKNAPSTNLPKDVGYHLGGDSGINYLTLQIHYAHKMLEKKDHSGLKLTMSPYPQKYMAGIYLLVSGYVDIPPHTAVTHADMNCRVGDTETVPINVFAYRTHSHKLGSVITGYKYSPETSMLVEFAKGNPQWPQAFYPTSSIYKMLPSDILHARCAYNSTTMETHTYIGSTAKDEMCNLYLMYYTDRVKGNSWGTCGAENYRSLTQALPKSSDEPLPPNPLLEDMTKGENHNLGKAVSYDRLFNPDDSLVKKQDIFDINNDISDSSDVSVPVKPDYKKDIRMPGVTPKLADSYLCSGAKVNKSEEWVLGYESLATADVAHHMMLFGCSDIKQEFLVNGFWDCGHHGVCPGGRIMYAWAKNAPPTMLPENVGYRIGGESGIRFLALQVHYAKALSKGVLDHSGIRLTVSHKPQKFKAGIFLLAASNVDIFPNTKVTHADINCQVGKTEPTDINVFAFRVHAHKLGSVITGYLYDQESNSLERIAKGNPHWPQAFYPTDKVYKIHPSHILHGRCTYDSTGSNVHTYIGATSKDEMCNLYLMYYTDREKGFESGGCGTEDFPSVTASLPFDSDTPLPPNPLLEEVAMGKHTDKGKEVLDEVESKENPIDVQKKQETTDYHTTNSGLYSLHPKLINSNGTIGPSSNTYETLREGKQLNHPGYSVVKDWGPKNHKLGAVTAVAIDNNGDVVIFHRGSVVWDGSSFRGDELVNRAHPISQPTILHLDRKTGTVKHEWGENLFYMPHGLSIDNSNNIWVTDVGLHQVFKFPPGFGQGAPAMSLGQRFVPGKDDKHFCKPTAVAIMKNGEFFVSDGYCNSRIIHYRSSGQIIKQFDSSYLSAIGPMQVPHSLTLVLDREICVADREKQRVLCFNVNNGKVSKKFDLGWGRLFAVTYVDLDGGQLFMVNGPAFFRTKKVEGFQVSYKKGEILSKFSPSNQGLNNPHDIAVEADGSELFVVEIGPNKIWKFEANSEPHSSAILSSLKEKGTSQDLISDRFSLFSHTWSPASVTFLVISLVAIPTIVLASLGLIIRYTKDSRMNYSRNSNFNFSMPGKSGGLTLGSLLNKHKGFEQVPNTDLYADDLDSEDSEVEEFSISATKV